MEDASGWEEATHPLVQTTDERRDVKGSGGGDEDASDVAALSAAEECQSAIVLGAVWVCYIILITNQQRMNTLQ